MLNQLKSKYKRLKKKTSNVKLFHFKREIAATMLLVFCFIFLSATLGSVKVLAVSVDGKTETIKTLNGDVLETIKKSGISWQWHDIVDVRQEGEKFSVAITRTFPVNLFIDGELHIEYVVGGTVGEFLNKRGITLAKDDEINVPLENALTDELEIKVKRIIYKEHTEEIKLAFSTKTVNVMYSSSIGQMPSDVAGKNGIRYVKKIDKMVDGVVLETKVLKDWVAEKPAEAIKYVAIKGPSKVVNGSEIKYKRILNMTATAYTYSSGGNRTATGKAVAVGCVAINPKYCKDLKLGDKLYIEGPDGRFIYGYCTVNDVGGIRDANWIDIFLPSQIDCTNFGRRTLKVYVLE